jgi:transcriptional regulator with XRE-family HTH domain
LASCRRCFDRPGFGEFVKVCASSGHLASGAKRIGRTLRYRDPLNPPPPSLNARPILPFGYNHLVTKSEIGLILAKARRRSGKTQAELAQAMGTTQPAIARAEAGYRVSTIGFIDRWARATGAPISLRLGQPRRGMQPAATRRAMVRSVLGSARFNPWDRNPTRVEAELLEKAGLSREHFERLKRLRGQRR